MEVLQAFLKICREFCRTFELIDDAAEVMHQRGDKGMILVLILVIAVFLCMTYIILFEKFVF